METQQEHSEGFFATLASTVVGITLFILSAITENLVKGFRTTVAYVFPFFGRPVERDLRAKIIGKHVEEIPLNRYAADYENDPFFLFATELNSGTNKIKVLVLKVRTYGGVFSVKTAYSFKDRIFIDDDVEALYQTSRRDSSILKGREIISKSVRIKSAFP